MSGTGGGYRPRGPRSESRAHNSPYRRDNRNRDSNNYGGAPKRYGERDSYRPSTKPPAFNQQENRPTRPSTRDNGFTPGTKRPLPSGPASFRKRPDHHHHNMLNNKILPSGPKREVQKKLTSDQIYCIKTTKLPNVYERVAQVGEGTYGKVYKAKHKITSEYVAMKKLRLESEKEGFPITAIREIKLLQSFDHENVVGLLEMMIESNQIYMVFDYLDHDLTGLLTHPDLKLEECHRKFIFKQLMEGLNYLHKKRIIHRDIKGSNILLDNIGRLKIADFGLARPMKIVNDDEKPDYTNRVITIWYRPPELLLGATDYGREVDVWGVGCLLIELYCKLAAFRGMDEISQLCKIFNIMGTPTLEDWPEIDRLPWFEMLKPKINVKSKFAKKYQDVMTLPAFKLAESLLELNPAKRPTAEDALEHEYFKEDPQPEPLYFLKEIKGEWHEFETKKRRREERKRIKEEEDAELAASKAASKAAATAAKSNTDERNTGSEKLDGSGDESSTKYNSTSKDEEN
ncbi:CTK1 CTD kinase subunit alpha [Candida maltosa Xu316]